MIKIVAFLAATALATSAVAAPSLTVTLQTTLSARYETSAGGVIWTCQADTCTPETVTDDLDAPAACSELARQLGPIAKFDALDSAALAKCNRHAKHA